VNRPPLSPALRPDWVSEILSKLDRGEKISERIETSQGRVEVELHVQGARLGKLEALALQHGLRLERLEEESQPKIPISPPTHRDHAVVVTSRHQELGLGRSEDTMNFLIQTLERHDEQKDAKAMRHLRKKSSDVLWKVIGAVVLVLAGLAALALISQYRGVH